MPDTATLRRAAEGVLAAVPKIDRIAAIDDRLAAIETARSEASRGRLPHDELAATLVQLLQKQRQTFETPTTSGYDSRLTAHDLVYGLSDTPARLRVRDVFHLFDVLAWLLGPQLEKAAADAIKGLDYEEGLPSAARAEQLTALAAERDRLVDEREQLVEDALTLSGGAVTVTHLPETSAKRATEAQRQRDDDIARLRQQERAASIDPRYAAGVRQTRAVDPDAPSRATRSSYLSDPASARAAFEQGTRPTR